VIDTFSSFVAGYGVAAALIVAYVVSLWARSRRLRARGRIG
jgi:hypothetical protein